jgi:hypothetical protein
VPHNYPGHQAHHQIHMVYLVHHDDHMLSCLGMYVHSLDVMMRINDDEDAAQCVDCNHTLVVTEYMILIND